MPVEIIYDRVKSARVACHMSDTDYFTVRASSVSNVVLETYTECGRYEKKLAVIIIDKADAIELANVILKLAQQ